MSSPVITLADDLVSRLGTATGYSFVRRNGPYLKASDVVDQCWLVVPASQTQAIVGRQVDRCVLGCDVALQIALPEPTDLEPSPMENQAWFDEQMDAIERVIRCFRQNGSLRNVEFAGGLFFQSMTNQPIYRPDLLIDQQMFISVVRLEFAGEIES